MNPHAGDCTGVGREDKEPKSLVICIRSREDHAFGNAKAHLPGSKIGDHDDQTALKVFGFVGALNARENIAGFAFANIQCDLQQLGGALNLLALDHLGYAQIHL